MAGAFWNIRGVNDSAKRDRFHDAVCDNKLEFVGFSETKKEILPISWLYNMTGSRPFTWHVVPSKGLSGSMALGVNTDVYEVLEAGDGEFFIRMLVKEKVSGFTWKLVSVYGAPHAKDRDRFLIELVQVISCNIFPSLIGGDFNILRTASDSNKRRKTSK
jgi:hypothetical protein